MLGRDVSQRKIWAILPLFIVFELFSANIDRREVYQILPPEQQPIMQIPPLVWQVREDRGGVSCGWDVCGGGTRYLWVWQ